MPKPTTPKIPEHPSRDNPMTIAEARKLATTMRASGNGLELSGCVDRDERGDLITFIGGRYVRLSITCQSGMADVQGWCEV
jgi:hypothetical protein